MKKKQEKVPFIRNYNRSYTYYTKIRRMKIIKRILTVIGILTVFLAGYFLMELLLNISHMPPL